MITRHRWRISSLLWPSKCSRISSRTVTTCHRRAPDQTALWLRCFGRIKSSAERSQRFRRVVSISCTYIMHIVYTVWLVSLSDVGEVWCEKCRCHLNPLNTQQFDLTHAQRCVSYDIFKIFIYFLNYIIFLIIVYRSLCFAIQFTPQYGDSFIEYIRLEMICQVLGKLIIATTSFMKP